jgi:hypothetical protein
MSVDRLEPGQNFALSESHPNPALPGNNPGHEAVYLEPEHLSKTLPERLGLG